MEVHTHAGLLKRGLLVIKDDPRSTELPDSPLRSNSNLAITIGLCFLLAGMITRPLLYLLTGTLLAATQLTAQEPLGGALDTSYAAAGIGIATNSSFSVTVNGMVVDTSGNAFIVGTAMSATSPVFSAVVYKLNASGELDNTFGIGGVKTLTLTHDFQGRAVAVQSDGKVIVTGQSNNSLVAVRLTAAGAPDTTYGSGGYATVSLGGQVPFVSAMTLDSNGRAVVVGSALPTSSLYRVLKLVRLTTSGLTDGTFGTSGVATLAHTSQDRVGKALRILPSGSIVVGGVDGTTTTRGFLCQFSATGYLWTTFGNTGNGIAQTPTTMASVVDVGIETSGRLVALGQASTGGDIAVARMTSFGVLDSTFSGDGLATFSVGTQGAIAAGMSLRTADRRIFIGCTALNSGSQDFCLLRVSPDGALDSGFDEDGVAIHSVGSGFDSVSAISLQSDGKVLLAGAALPSVGSPVFAMATARVFAGALVPLPLPVFTAYPQGVAATVGQTVTLSCTVESSLAVSYVWRRNGSVIFGSGSSLTFSASASSEGTYTVEAINLMGSETSTGAVVTVSQPPKIDAVPSDVVTFEGGSSFHMTLYLSGRRPMTLQWLKNGQPFGDPQIFSSISPTASLYLASTASSQGSYSCHITNTDGSITSSAADVIVKPANTVQVSPEPSVLLLEGSYAELNALFLSSLNALSYQWIKQGRSTSVGFSRSLSLAAPTLTDAGSYHCRVSTLNGPYNSQPVTVRVVGRSDAPTISALGYPAEFTVMTGGTDLRYAWHKGGLPLSNNGSISGADTATLRLESVVASDATASYTCLVTDPQGNQVWAPERALVFATEPPTLDVIPDQVANVNTYHAFSIPVANLASQYDVTGLPPGLSVMTSADAIAGVPRRTGTYTVSVVARNILGMSETRTFTIIVHPFQPRLVGTFNGPVGDFAGHGMSGVHRIVISKSGAFTASVQISDGGSKLYTLAFKGAFADSDGTIWEAVSPPVAWRTTPFGAPMRVRLSFSSEITEDGMNLVGSISQIDADGNREDGLFTIDGYRDHWKAAPAGARPYAGYHTASLEQSDHISGIGGFGYAQISVSNNGSVVWSGRLQDGTAFTGSTHVSHDGKLFCHRWIQGNRGFLSGLINLSTGQPPFYRDSAVGGDLRWRCAASAYFRDDGNAVPNGYYAGFQTNLNVNGSRYLPPNISGVTGPLVMGLSGTTTTVNMNINGGVVEDDDFGVAAVLPGGSTKIVVSHTYGNVQFNSLRFNPAKGTFSGTATARRSSPTSIVSQPAAKLNFQGIVVRPDPSFLQSVGRGFFSSLQPWSIQGTNSNGDLVPLRTIRIRLSGGVTIGPNTP
jgi:uncharacterized delta-60 repeat protein